MRNKGKQTTNPKDFQIRFRMSQEDIAVLDECCKLTGMTKTDIFRYGIRKVLAEAKK